MQMFKTRVREVIGGYTVGQPGDSGNPNCSSVTLQVSAAHLAFYFGAAEGDDLSCHAGDTI